MATEKKYQEFKDITPAQIAEWKNGHKSLTEVSIPVDDDNPNLTAKFIICEPTRAVINASAKYSADKDYERANKLMINSCVLGGDMKFLDKEAGEYKVELKLLEQIGSLMEIKQVSVKKL